MSTMVQDGGRLTGFKMCNVSTGAASFHTNKILNKAVGPLLKRFTIEFITFGHGNNAHTSKVRWIYYMNT